MSSSLRRRECWALLLLALVGAAVPSIGNGFSPPAVEVLEVKTISSSDGRYHAWPTMARRANGQLLVVYSGGREGHIGPFGRVDMIVSHDQGEAWSWPRTIFDGNIDDRDAGIVETKSGTLLVTTFSSLSYVPALNAVAGQRRLDEAQKARWNAAHNRLEAGEHKAELGQWMLRSSDGGRSWSTPYRTIVNSPHGPIQLTDGRLIYVGRELSGPGKRVGVAESVDDGVSWRWLADIPFSPGHSYANYHELHAVEAENGRLVAHIRYIKEGEPEEILQSESLDRGRSWTVPRPLRVFGFPSHLLRLSGGRLLMTYGFRNKPTGVRARISSDNGGTWGDEMMITTDGTSSDLGYPSTVELSDGVLLTVWYERIKPSKLAVLRQVKWTISGSAR